MRDVGTHVARGDRYMATGTGNTAMDTSPSIKEASTHHEEKVYRST